MKTKEFGESNSEVIVMLHGGGLSWWNYKQEAEILKSKYHVVIPFLDGHADSDKGFTSIEDNAHEIISYIDDNFGGKVFLICGLSLGGQILVEMLSQRDNICKYAIVESALVIPMKFTNILLKPSVSISYSLIKKPWFSKLQFKSLNIDDLYYNDYYKDSCKVLKDDMVRFLKASSDYCMKNDLSSSDTKVLILVGTKEPKKMIESAKLLNKTIKNSTLNVLNGYTHGDISLNHADEYTNLVKKFISQ